MINGVKIINASVKFNGNYNYCDAQNQSNMIYKDNSKITFEQSHFQEKKKSHKGWFVAGGVVAVGLCAVFHKQLRLDKLYKKIFKNESLIQDENAFDKVSLFDQKAKKCIENLTAWIENIKSAKGKTSYKTPSVLTNYPLASEAALNQSNKFAQQHFIDFDEKILDGYRDAGRKIRFMNNGLPTGCNGDRETLILDRTKDKILRDTVEEFKKEMSQANLSEEEKLFKLFEFVYKKLGGKMLINEPKDIAIGAHPVLLGNIIESGYGVCRHKALLAKVLGDEVGIKTKLVRRSHISGEPHVWNEVKLSDGKRVLLDVAQHDIMDISNPKKVKNSAFKYVDWDTNCKQIPRKFMYIDSDAYYAYYGIQNLPTKADGVEFVIKTVDKQKNVQLGFNKVEQNKFVLGLSDNTFVDNPVRFFKSQGEVYIDNLSSSNKILIRGKDDVVYQQVKTPTKLESKQWVKIGDYEFELALNDGKKQI